MGVEKQIIRPGTGPKPAPGQTVTVHCTGFGNLSIFEASHVADVVVAGCFAILVTGEMDLIRVYVLRSHCFGDD